MCQARKSEHFNPFKKKSLNLWLNGVTQWKPFFRMENHLQSMSADIVCVGGDEKCHIPENPYSNANCETNCEWAWNVLFKNVQQLTMWRWQRTINTSAHINTFCNPIEKFRFFMNELHENVIVYDFSGISLKFYSVFIDFRAHFEFEGIPFGRMSLKFRDPNNATAHVFPLRIHSMNGAHMCERVVDEHFNY